MHRLTTSQRSVWKRSGPLERAFEREERPSVHRAPPEYLPPTWLAPSEDTAGGRKSPARHRVVQQLEGRGTGVVRRARPRRLWVRAGARWQAGRVIALTG